MLYFARLYQVLSARLTDYTRVSARLRIIPRHSIIPTVCGFILAGAVLRSAVKSSSRCRVLIATVANLLKQNVQDQESILDALKKTG